MSAWRRGLFTNCCLLLATYLVLFLSFQYYLTTLTQDSSYHGITERQLLENETGLKFQKKLHLKSYTKNNTNVSEIILPEKDVVYHASGTKFRLQRFDKFSPKCNAVIVDEGGNRRPIFPKIYIYDLPSDLNIEMAKCTMEKNPCFDISDCGIGEILHTDYDLHVHSTWQFSLETIIHNKLMLSPHQTKDPDLADIFYVPYYGAMACFCFARFDPISTQQINKNVDALINFLNNSTYYKKGKPHLLTVSKIEREQASKGCPLLQKLKAPHLRYIGIEQESDPGHREHYMKIQQDMIVAPYPSYGHLSVMTLGQYEKSLYSTQRNIFVFLAASSRRSNTFRAKLLDQLTGAKTVVGFKDYLTSKGLNASTKIDALWLVTTECHGKHKYYTMEYMKRATFCIQPAGDSPTRKSFYDGLISGCIPVLFKERYPVKWAFDQYVPYSNFTVTFSTSLVNNRNSIVEELHKIPDSQIKSMQNLTAKYLKYFQYNYPPSNLPHDDAIKMILQEATDAFQLKESK